MMCIHGGGLDPNPNLFQSLIARVIPIIAPFPGGSMYKGLPVVVTDGNWSNPDFFSQEYLAKKLDEFAPFFEDSEKRYKVIKRLTMNYWWEKVERVINETSN